MTNNKFLKAFMSVSIVSVALILILGVAIAQDSLPTFTIGVLDTAHGPIANGAKLAVREINEAGGVEGADGTFFRLQLVIQPVEDGDILTEAVNNLNQEEIIAVIGPKTTADVLSNLPLLQSLGVPILTPAIGDTVIASDTTGSLFRIRAAERWQGSSLASYLVNQLNLQQITTVQLDRNSTAARVGFSIALEQLSSSTTETSLLLESEDQLDNLVTQIIANNPPAIVTFGEPAIANDFFTLLRIGGWVGAFAYHRADTPEFRNCADTEICRGVIGTTTWSLSSVDLNSNVFLNNYVRAFDEAPGAIEAASYDAVNMLALAIGQPGALRDNLSAIRDIPGVQGMLNTGGLEAREMTNYTAVIQINALGGTDLVARYAGFDRLPEDESTIVDGGELPVLPTATPEGVYVTIESGRQNVRTGPGLEYDVLGQMQQGESADGRARLLREPGFVAGVEQPRLDPVAAGGRRRLPRSLHRLARAGGRSGFERGTPVGRAARRGERPAGHGSPAPQRTRRCERAIDRSPNSKDARPCIDSWRPSTPRQPSASTPTISCASAALWKFSNL
jgi:branched-chain amino acid transport system substrate-binding protein